MPNLLNLLISELVSLIISSIISLVFNFFNIPIVILLSVIILLLFRLISLRLLFKKICVGRKEYYDIMADIVYFSNKPSRNNNFIFNTLEWNMDCRYSESSDRFLDIMEKWDIQFTPCIGKVQQICLAFRGGDAEDLSLSKIKAVQDGNLLSMPCEHGVGCGYLFELASTIGHKENCHIELSFTWPEFIVIDRNDDYFYLLPRSQAKEIKLFKVKITHPYKCYPEIVFFKKGVIGYSHYLINNQNKTQYKIQFNYTDEKFDLQIQDIGSMDVLLIIFHKDE